MPRPGSSMFISAVYYATVVLLFCFVSCRSNEGQVAAVSNVKKIPPPKIIRAGKPYMVDLDTCPKPQTITTPVKDSVYFTLKNPDGERRLKLGPPTVHPADYFVTMLKFANEDGLEAHSVFSSFQDRGGNMWFGTHGGSVTRFDGKTAVTFSNLPCNDVRDIIEDREGNIWFATGGCGAIKYDGTGLTNYTIAQGIIDNEVRCFALDANGDLWMGTETSGISCFNGKQFKNYDTSAGVANNRIRCITPDKKGNIWFGTDAGASCFNGKTFSTLTMPGDKADKLNNYIRSIVCNKKGELWFGTANGIFRYDGHSFHHFTVADGVANNNVTCIKEDNNGNLWIGTYGGGISKYDGHSFKNLTKKQGLSGDFVKTITAGANGSVWIGAEGGSVCCYDGSAVTSYTTAQGLFNNYVVSIKEDRNGKLWMGSNSGGVCVYDGETFTNFSTYQGFTQKGRVNFILQDKKDHLWFCSNSGFSCYNGTSFTNYNTLHGIRNPQVQCVTEDRTGNLWFGVEFGGVSVFNGKTIANFTTAQGLAGNNVRSIICDSTGSFWIGTFGGGISRYNGKNFINLDSTQGLLSNSVLCMRQDSKGNLWIGTGISGVSILRKENIDKIEKGNSPLPAEIFESFTTNEGLANNTVYDIIEDKNGNIFLATNFGLTVIKHGILPGRKIQNADIEHYNQKTGYPITDMNERAMFVDSKGMLWAGTGGDLVRFDYSAVRKSKLPPHITIQGVKINNDKPGWHYLQYTRHTPASSLNNYMLSAVEIEEKINYGNIQNTHSRDSVRQNFMKIKFDNIAKFYPVPLNLVLPYSHNNITIEFGADEVVKPSLVKYQYMLEGYDKDWSPASNQSFATFGNIREGSYTFLVKAMSPDGVWSKPVTYTFKVLPPWRRSWLAIALYTAIVFLFLYVVYRARIRTLEAKQALQLQTVIATQEEERKRISRDLHDDVGTKLSALKLFLSSLKSQAEKKQYQQVEQLASNSEQLITDTIKDVREMLLNLSPGILEEFGYVHAIESLINKINQTNSIHVTLSVFGITHRPKKEYELALYRITQELINNVLKHSAAKNVSVQMGYRDEKIIVMVEDDGKGFDVNEHKDGYGLKNLDARTRLLNGSMLIDSKPGKGTSVLIEVPYKFNPS